MAKEQTKEQCYWCGQQHDPKNCPIGDEEKLKRCYRAIASPLIDGDYIGPLRGEVNVCLNVIYYYKAFEEAARQILGYKKFSEVRELAFKIRAEKWGRLLW